MTLWGDIFFIGIIFSPIIYLILSYIADSISDNVKESKRKKLKGIEEIKYILEDDNNITRKELIDFFTSQIKSYRRYYFLINYEVYSDSEKQNDDTWAVFTSKEKWGWGELIDIKIFFSNGLVCFRTSDKQFSTGGELSKEYYLYKRDLGSYEIDRVLKRCREEAIMRWKENGLKPNGIMPFNFKPLSSQNKSSNSTRNKKNNKQKENSSYNQNIPDLHSFYRNLLGLKLQFTQTELKDAYRKAVTKYHPDRYGTSDSRSLENAEILMKQVNEAYEILKV